MRVLGIGLKGTSRRIGLEVVCRLHSSEIAGRKEL